MQTSLPYSIQSTGSPKGLMGSLTNQSNFFSVADSVVNTSSCYNYSKDRKMCLSEKLQPKGKKKRTQAQKQPKQVSQTKDSQQKPVTNSIASGVPLMILTNQSSYQQQIDSVVNQTPTKKENNPTTTNDPSFANQSMASNLKHNITIEETLQSQQFQFKTMANPPSQHQAASVFDDTEHPLLGSQQQQQHPSFETKEIPQLSYESPNHQQLQQQNTPSSTSNIINRERSQTHLFSFQIYGQSNTQSQTGVSIGRQSLAEESKEVTAIFSGIPLDSLNAEYRTSREGTAEKKKQTEIPTPVFQATEHSFRPSDIIQADMLRLMTDESSQLANDPHYQMPDFKKASEQVMQQQQRDLQLQQERLMKDKIDKMQQKQDQDRQAKTQRSQLIAQNLLEEQQKLQEFKRSQQQNTTNNNNIDNAAVFSKNNRDKFNKSTALQQDFEISSKTMKKVNSSAQIGFRTDTTPVRDLNDSNYTQSSGNLFSKLKSLIFQGAGGIRSDSSSRVENDYYPQYRCKCEPSGHPYACKSALNWFSHSNNYQDFEYDKYKKLYQNLIRIKDPSGSESQIERDISRTFPNVDPHMSSQEGQQQLQRVLTAFSKYDKKIGYVQGMNFIVGALLYHCTEDIAFWLFVTLIEDYEMRDIYQPKLPGLYKHSQILQLLQMEHLHDLYEHFCTHNIQVEMYASDWIFALFSNIIPITEYHLFLDHFFQDGWVFFYKFSLSFLKSLSDELVNCLDISEILTIIKLKHVKQKELIQSTANTHHSEQQQQNSLDFFSNQNTENSRRLTGAGTFSERDNSPGRASAIQSRMKTMFNKFVLGKEDKITSESYNNQGVWEKLVAVSLKDWETDFNESCLMNLLTNFDSENLVFKQSQVGTPKDEQSPHKLLPLQMNQPATQSSHKKKSSDQTIFFSRDVIATSTTRPNNTRAQHIRNDSKSQMSSSRSNNVHLYQGQHQQLSERGSIQPFNQIQPIEMIPSRVNPNKYGSGGGAPQRVIHGKSVARPQLK